MSKAAHKDTFYLDAAAHRMHEYLESTKLPGKGRYYTGPLTTSAKESACSKIALG